jgi:hypothetical protein
MFSLGKHLGMQCHVEITPELVAAWCADWGREITSPMQCGPSVQTPAQMLVDVNEKCVQLHGVADHIYGQWLQGLTPAAILRNR